MSTRRKRVKLRRRWRCVHRDPVKLEAKYLAVIPFGKHAGTLVCRLPSDYLKWLVDRSWVRDDLRQAGAAILADRRSREGLCSSADATAAVTSVAACGEPIRSDGTEPPANALDMSGVGVALNAGRGDEVRAESAEGSIVEIRLQDQGSENDSDGRLTDARRT